MTIPGLTTLSRQAPDMKLLIAIGAVVALVLLGSSAQALAQGVTGSSAQSRPTVGGTGGTRPPAQLPPINGSAPEKVHTGPTGKPCLSLSGYALPQAVNPNIFNHMISANNDCSQPIKVKVCYYQSQHCAPPIDVPGYGRKDTTLGIMPAMRDFRFEYREQFDLGFGGAPIN
jgi:hypothetical protein